MVKKWKSAAEIRRSYKVSPDAELDDLRRTVKIVCAENHPDKFQAGWPDRARQSFEKASAALEFLDNSTNNSLAAVDNKTAIALRETNERLMVLQEKQLLAANEAKLSALATSAKAAVERSVSHHYRTWKFSAGTLVALSAFLLLVKDELASVLELSLAKQSPMVGVGLAYLAIVGGVLGLMGYWREQQEKEKKLQLLTESGFAKFIKSEEFRHCVSDVDETVSVEGISSALGEYARIHDETTCNEIAQYFVERLEGQGLVTRVRGKHLLPRYAISKDLL